MAKMVILKKNNRKILVEEGDQTYTRLIQEGYVEASSVNSATSTVSSSETQKQSTEKTTSTRTTQSTGTRK